MVSLCRTKYQSFHVCSSRSRVYSSDVGTLPLGFNDVSSTIGLGDDLMTHVLIKPGETSFAVSTARLDKENSSMSLKQRADPQMKGENVVKLDLITLTFPELTAEEVGHHPPVADGSSSAPSHGPRMRDLKPPSYAFTGHYGSIACIRGLL